MSAESDIREIYHLKAKYFRFLDTKQWSDLRQILTDDFSFSRSNPPVAIAVDPDEWIEKIIGTLGSALTVHHGHMPEIDISSERTATGIWAMYDIIDYGHGKNMQGFGHYHENYEKGSDDVWRIRSITLSRLRVDDEVRRDLG